MKIPDAYFDGGFGQRQAKPEGAVMPDNSGAAAIGQAGQQLGATVEQYGFQQMEEQGRNDLAEAHDFKSKAEAVMREQDAELKQMAQQREHAQAKVQYFNFENDLSNIHQAVIDDPDVSPEDYPAEFRKRAQDVALPLRQKLNERQWLTIGPDVQNRINLGAQGMFKAGQQEINDNAWADDISSAEALMNDPTKTARQKVQIISDENFFSDTGRPAHEIEAQRQKYIDKAIENEVVTALNNTKGNVPQLQQFASELRKQGDEGQYSYMPEMDIKTRERYIDLAQSSIRSAEAEQKRQEAEAKRLRTEQGRTAFDLYKTAKEGLQPLSPNEENHLLRQMQGTPYYEAAKRVQKTTTSIGFVLEKVKQDPLTVGAAQLGLSIPPLDPRSSGNWPQQLNQRGQIAQAVKQKYGLSYLPILTNQEAKGLVDFMGAQSPRGIVQTVQGMANIPGMKGDSMNRVSQQVAAADPGIGMVVGLAANGRDDAAFHVANGLQIIKGKAATDLKGKGSIAADLDDRFNSNLKDAVSDNPRMREALQNATRAAYISMAAAQGKDDGSMNKDVFDQAFKSVVGDTAKINGKRVVIPSGMGEGTFKDFFKNVSADTVKYGGGVRGFNDPQAAASAIRSGGQLYESGMGRYRVSIGGKFLQNNNGQDFILSLGSHY
jgi:hypothetical protein